MIFSLVLVCNIDVNTLGPFSLPRTQIHVLININMGELHCVVDSVVIS